MKQITLVAFLLYFSTSAYCAVPRQYQVDMKLSFDGKLVASPRVVINEGKKAEISDNNAATGEGNFIELLVNRVPSKDDDQAAVQMIVGRLKNGKKEIVGSPQIVALENEESAMEISEGEKQLFKVNVTVSRVKSAKSKR